MNSPLQVRHCQIIAPEKLPDRFLVSGVHAQNDSSSLEDQVFLAYVFEITKPWFSSSRVIPTLTHVLEEEASRFKAGKTLIDQFERLLQRINQELGNISEGGETDWIGNFNGLILALANNELHFSQTGRIPTYLLQKNRIRQISDDSGEQDPHPLRTFTNLASGRLEIGDYLLFATQELFHEISLDALRRVVSGQTPYAASAAITNELKREKSAAISSIILHITTEEQGADEPTALYLEEEFQSSVKKLQKKAAPYFVAAKDLLIRLFGAAKKGASVTGTAIRTKVPPLAKGIYEKGAAGAQELNKLPRRPRNSAPLVEIIPPRTERLGEAETTQLAPSLAANLHTSLMPWLQTNKKLLGLALGIVLLAGTAYFATQRGKTPITADQINSNAQALEQASAAYEQAVALRGEGKDDEAADALLTARGHLNILASLDDKQAATADGLWQKLDEQTDLLVPTTRFTAAKATFKLTEASGQFIATSSYVYALSGAAGTLERTGYGSPELVRKTLTLPNAYADDTLVAITEAPANANAAAFVLSRNNNVFRVTQEESETRLQYTSSSDNGFKPGDAIATYLNNIYILDSKSGLLWRYAPAGIGYGKGESIIDTTRHDLKNSVDLAIDGSIYVLYRDGNMNKFTSGALQDFSLKNLSKLAAITTPLQVSTSEASSSIYVLDGGLASGIRNDSRVLEFDKNGNFIRQYVFPQDLVNVKNFDVDPIGRKIWLLADASIHEFAF